jgi:hypothetical protein
MNSQVVDDMVSDYVGLCNHTASVDVMEYLSGRFGCMYSVGVHGCTHHSRDGQALAGNLGTQKPHMGPGRQAD